MTIKVARPVIGQEEIDAAVEVLKSGNFISGKKVEEFEEKFADYIGTKYAVACNSGTAALHMTYSYIGLDSESTFIVPPMSFFATISAGMMCGAYANFTDVDNRCNMRCTEVEDLIGPSTKAIVPVHFLGHPAEIEAIKGIADKYDIPVVEDCAQAIGAEYKGQKVGSFGFAGCFSFFATKNMTTVEGGMITTNDEDFYNKAKKLRSHGMIDRHTHSYLGYNYRMTELNAAIGLEQLKKLDNFNTTRIQIADMYKEKLNNDYITPFKDRILFKNVYFWFPVLARFGKKFSEHLTDNGIGFRYRYTEPLYKQPIFRRIYKDLKRTMAENYSGNVFGLPINPDMKPSEVDEVIKVVNDFYPAWRA